MASATVHTWSGVGLDSDIPAHVLYYADGLLAIGAVTFFITRAWESWAGWPMLGLALSLAGLGPGLIHHFLGRDVPVPAGISGRG